MKILIQSTNGGAFKYINLGLARAFSAMGFEAILWTDPNKSVFDLFDEVNPDIFYGQTYNLTESIIKCIQERPTISVVLRASDHSHYSREIEKKYPVLVANEKEITLVNKLREKTGKPHILHNHYIQKSINTTHEDWIKEGYNVKGFLLAADLFDFFGGTYNEKFASDIAFIGGYLPLKTPSINKNLMRVVQNGKYKIKIFGNMPWPTHYYCGYAPDDEAKNILKSAKVCPCLSEIHSLEYGYDVIERYFKLGSNKCLCIADYVQDAVDLFPDVIHCKTPEEFEYNINYWTQKDFDDEERISKIDNHYKLIMKNHTYFDRAKEMLSWLNIDSEINTLKGKFDENYSNW